MAFLSDTVNKQNVLKRLVKIHQEQIELYEELYSLMKGEESVRAVIANEIRTQKSMQKTWFPVIESMQKTINLADEVMIKMGGKP